MRSYVCAQCHVEYYFESKKNPLLHFPWKHGYTLDDMERYYDEEGFHDWVHPESGAKLIKMQHPDFELWSTGIHARSGVSCADCHMPFKRVGSQKISDHWVRSPLVNVAAACQTCHRWSEDELKSRVMAIQVRTRKLMDRSEEAIISAIRAIKTASDAGADDTALEKARSLHRKAQMRWDYVQSENSMGFHSPQEAARLLGEAIDYARQAEVEAIKASTVGGKTARTAKRP
jgi:nitrite reductase (cytochrome c-552)